MRFCLDLSRQRVQALTLALFCHMSAVCSGRPPATITSGSFPTSCSDTPTGQVCYGVCNNGYTAVEPPTTACLANATSPTGGSWATTSQGLCARGESHDAEMQLLADEVVVLALVDSPDWHPCKRGVVLSEGCHVCKDALCSLVPYL